MLKTESLALPSAWDNGVDDPVWSHSLRMHDNEGNVGILGVDCPARNPRFPRVEQGFRRVERNGSGILIIT